MSDTEKSQLADHFDITINNKNQTIMQDLWAEQHEET